mgnify:CR=1 FL=1
MKRLGMIVCLFGIAVLPSSAENWSLDRNGFTHNLVFTDVVSSVTSFSNALYIPDTAKVASVTIRGGTEVPYVSSITGSMNTTNSWASIIMMMFPTKAEADAFLEDTSKTSPPPLFLAVPDSGSIAYGELNDMSSIFTKFGTYILPTGGCRYMVIAIIPTSDGATAMANVGMTIKVNFGS